MGDTIYIKFTDHITTKPVEELIKKCEKALNELSPKNINIFFSSCGGDINLAFILYGYLKSLPTNIIMHGVGNIDSCALNVFLAGKERYASPGTTFLIHSATRTYKKDCSLTIRQLQSDLDILRIDQERIINHIVVNSELKKEYIYSKIIDGITLTTETAIEHGIIIESKDFAFNDECYFLELN